jgi:AraC-like DNA-binding protein
MSCIASKQVHQNPGGELVYTGGFAVLPVSFKQRFAYAQHLFTGHTLCFLLSGVDSVAFTMDDRAIALSPFSYHVLSNSCISEVRFEIPSTSSLLMLLPSSATVTQCNLGGYESHPNVSLIQMAGTAQQRLLQRRMFDTDLHSHLGRFTFDLLARAWLLEFCKTIIKNHSAGDDPFNRKIAQEALQFIQQDEDGIETVVQLAGRLRVSVSRLYKAFKDVYGCSPARYLRERRMQRAYDLLRTTNFPLRAVSTMVGYRDVSNFSHAFRNCYGCWPGAIAKKSDD